jgi:co-chaperonin GroES (HSP10)|tara:strand:+ start:395 stop:637 length:243 start_codon:yes stop_codon:yes gene_type:complete
MKPIGEYIAIDISKKYTSGGIITSIDNEGVVISLGKLVSDEIQVGDKILYKCRGEPPVYDNYLFLKESEVICVLGSDESE